MYRNTIVATAVALAGTALAQNAGQAVVVNSCSYPVYVQNTPSADGGFNPISQTLQSGATYSQEWTELTNGNGWSIKLSKDDGDFEDEVMQYEYTWHGWDGEWGGVIWYDLSDVNGNPWNGNWELTATGACTPRQAAYQYSTDDAYGMQSCPGSSSITVTLCSGDSDSTGGSSPAASSPAQAPASSAQTSAQTTAQAPQTTATAAPFIPQFQAGNVVNNKQQGTPTTLATVNRGGVTVTEVATEVVTNFVTATAEAANKRHLHVARHAHHHNF